MLWLHHSQLSHQSHVLFPGESLCEEISSLLSCPNVWGAYKFGIQLLFNKTSIDFDMLHCSCWTGLWATLIADLLSHRSLIGGF